jgi:hypothetical protein
MSVEDVTGHFLFLKVFPNHQLSNAHGLLAILYMSVLQNIYYTLLKGVAAGSVKKALY